MRVCAILWILLIPMSIQAQSARHLEAAHELIAAQNLEAGNGQRDSAYAQWLLEQNPDLADYRDLVEEYSHKVYDWSAVEAELAHTLTSLFTEAELHEITAFWKRPVGRKWAATAPIRQHTQGGFVDRRFDKYYADFQGKLRAKARRYGRKEPAVRHVDPT
jgi:hypothetical protein